MKGFIVFLLFICHQFILAQTPSSSLLNKINDYRTKNGFCILKFSNTADSLVKSHNNYMAVSSKLSHTEIYGHDTIPSDRRLGNKIYNVENVAGDEIPDRVVVDGVLINTADKSQQSIEFLTNLVFLAWKESTLHNKNMLDKRIKYASAQIHFDYVKNIFVADFIGIE